MFSLLRRGSKLPAETIEPLVIVDVATIEAPPPPLLPPSRINEAALHADLVSRHGGTTADVLFPHALSKARAAEIEYNDLVNAKTDVDTEIERRQAGRIEKLIPLRAAMNAAYTVWLSACKELEDARVTIDAECSDLVNNRVEIQSRIATLQSPHAIGTWSGKPSWFQEPMPERPSIFHEHMHAQQLREKNR